MEDAPKLTDLQRKFVAAYLAEPEGRGKPGRAAVAAGYSDKHAAVTACRLLKDARILAAIELARGAGGKLPEPKALPVTNDPLVFLKAVMNDPTASPHQRIDAAKALAPYMHARMGETGKKEAAQQAAAKQAVTGRFKPGARPGPLRAVPAGG